MLGNVSWMLGEVLRKASFRHAAWNVRGMLRPHLEALERVEPRYKDAMLLFRLAQLQESYALSPGGAATWVEEIEKAVSTYSEVIRRKPAFPPAYYWRGNARYALGCGRADAGLDARTPLEGAIADYDRYLARPPEQVDPHYPRLYRALSRFRLAEWLRIHRQGDPVPHLTLALSELDAIREDETEAWIPRATIRLSLTRNSILAADFAPANEAGLRATIDRAVGEARRSVEGAATDRDRGVSYALIGHAWLALALLEERLGRVPTRECRLAALEFRKSAPAGEAGAAIWAASATAVLARSRAAAGLDPSEELRSALEDVAAAIDRPLDGMDREGDRLAPDLEVLLDRLEAVPATGDLAPGALALGRLFAALHAGMPGEGPIALAFRALAEAKRHGPVDWADLVSRDPAVAALRSDPRWAGLTGE